MKDQKNRPGVGIGVAILKNGKVYFIDFGLGFFSNKTEDKAVDLHLLKQALESKHYQIFENDISIYKLLYRVIYKRKKFT